MDLLGQSSLLVAVTSFALGISILARNIRNKLYLSFGLLCLLISAWAGCFFSVRVLETPWMYRFHLVLNVWLAPAGIGFIHVMNRIRDGFSRRLLDLSALLALLFTLALVTQYDSISWIKWGVYCLPSLIAVQTLRLMWNDRRLIQGMKLRPKLSTVGIGAGKRTVIYLGALVVLFSSAMDHIPWISKEFASLGNLALTIYLFILSQAVLQQRLLNFGTAISRFLVLLMMALTLTGIYSLLFTWIQDRPAIFFLDSFIVSFLLIMMLDPLRSLVRYFTSRLLTKEHRRLETTLQESQRKLAGIVDRESLAQAVLLTVQQTIHPSRAAFFSLRSDGTKFARITVVLGPEGEMDRENVREMLVDHPLIQYCQQLTHRGDLPIVLEAILENELDRSASKVQRDRLRALIQGMKALGSNLLIPFMDGERVLGFVAMDVTAPPEPWGNNWGLLHLLYPYFHQASNTLRNMEVYVRQREKERLAALGEMAAGLAHEIRNPLGAIKGAAQFLDPSSDRPESGFLKVIVEEVDRLNRVVTQFLDYSKPYAIEKEPVNLVLLVRKTLESMKPGIRSGVVLEFQEPDYPVWVKAASVQIQQVLVNLVQNSIHALHDREDGRVRIAINRYGKKEASVIVEDNGPGIKRENLDKIFIPFFTTAPSGTGLGLPICQKIIENHQGRIDVQTEEGRFTRFVIFLPSIEPKMETEVEIHRLRQNPSMPEVNP